MEWKYVTKKNFNDSIKHGVCKTFIDSVLGAGFDIRSRRNNGFTVLSFAAEFGDLEFVKYLVEKGADCNATNCGGTQPIHIAVKHSHKDVVEFFINLGVSVDSRDSNNRTPLHYIVETLHKSTFNSYGDLYHPTLSNLKYFCLVSEKHKELSYSLLVKGADCNARDSKGDVPLLLAAKYACVEVVRLLIIWGADIESYDKKKWNVLHYASFSGWLDVVQPLIDRKCNVNAKTSCGDTPLSLSLHGSHRDIFDLLIKSGSTFESCDREKVTMLDDACKFGWMDVVQILVEREFIIDAQTYVNNEPLLLAAKFAHKGIVEMLLGVGAQLEGCDNNRWTLLHYACKSGWLNIVQYLIKIESDINAKNNDGRTPLFIAAKLSHIDIFDCLLEAGAGVDIAIPIGCSNNRVRVILGRDSEFDDGQDWTVLHHACYEGWLEVLVSLIKKTVDVNLKTCGGNTPLHIAVKGGKLEIVEHLLKAGADCNEQNDEGESAFQYFVQQSLLSANLVRLFIENGALVLHDDFNTLIKHAFFKDDILQDSKLCTQVVINLYNNSELVKIYEEPLGFESLPPIEGMKIRNNRNMAYSIEQSVRRDIEINGYCNIVEICPIVLSLLSARSIISHVFGY